VLVIADPAAVQECLRAGAGTLVDLTVGGKTDSMHGDPVAISGRVTGIHDGQFEETEPRHGGRRFNNQGLTAVVQVEQSGSKVHGILVITTERQPPFSLQQLISVGIRPEKQRILVVKAAIAYRAAYEPIAKRIIEVDTPGITGVDLSRFTYVNRVRELE
jgi:microcystin degradation protein MlrC